MGIMEDKIRRLLMELGMNVCGIANVERFVNAPSGFHPTDILSSAKSVIVFGKSLSKGVFVAKTNVPYTLLWMNLSQRIDDAATILSLKIEEEGFVAVPIPSSEPYEYWNSEQRHGKGILSLKHAAVLAGLGCLGKNTLLINEKFGNRLWLGAVISNIELQQGEITENLCPESCRTCIDSCPQAALDGNCISQKKCREKCFSSTEGGGWIYACNNCRKACPL